MIRKIMITSSNPHFRSIRMWFPTRNSSGAQPRVLTPAMQPVTTPATRLVIPLAIQPAIPHVIRPAIPHVSAGEATDVFIPISIGLDR